MAKKKREEKLPVSEIEYISLYKKLKASIFIYIFSLLLSGLSISFIPLLKNVGEKITPSQILIASVFWVGLIVSIINLAYSTILLRKNKNQSIVKEFVKNKRMVGIISFSSKKQSLFLYLFFVLCVGLITADTLIMFIPETFMYFIVSATMILFFLHCVIDGKCYELYKKIEEKIKNEK